MEQWKDIPWYEWIYQVSNEWRMKSLQSRWWKLPWIMNPQVNYEWYYQLSLTNNNGKRSTCRLHRLIASAFLWFDLNTKMKDWVIMHLDSNPSNNRLENLKIWTQSENTKQCISEWRWKQFWRKWEQHWHSKLTEEQVLKIRKLNAEWVWYGELVNLFQVSKTNISDIVKRNIWKHI